jgi:flagella basal body P-ring formation protein FlgA
MGFLEISVASGLQAAECMASRTVRIASVALLLAAYALHRPALAAGRTLSEVEQRVAASLPRDLVLVDLFVPGWPRRSPTGNVQIDWPAPPRAGEMTVKLSVLERVSVRWRGWARLKLARVARVLVARRSLAAGEVLARADLASVLRPVGADRQLTMPPEGLIGALVARPVLEGHALLREDVSLPPALARGSNVTLLVERGGVSVTTPGVLERPARLGEETQVRAPVLGRVVRGRLLGPDTVVVERSGP